MDKGQKDSEHWFFVAAGIWFVLLAFFGFSQSFFLRSDPQPLPSHLVMHGLVYSAWVLLFLVQALLIFSRNTMLHRRLGTIAVVLLLAMIPTGFYAVLFSVSIGFKTVDAAGFNLATLSLGFCFAFAGIANRKTPFVHKRLMLFATMVLTVAAADRVAFLFGMDEVRIFRKILAVVPGLAITGFDLVKLRAFPRLSFGLLLAVWLIIYYIVSDWFFTKPAGEVVINSLVRLFIG